MPQEQQSTANRWVRRAGFASLAILLPLAIYSVAWIVVRNDDRRQTHLGTLYRAAKTPTEITEIRFDHRSPHDRFLYHFFLPAIWLDRQLTADRINLD